MLMVKDWLLHSFMGLPVWGWLLLFAAMVVNDLVQRSGWIRAQSTLQAIGDALQRLGLGRVPLISMLIGVLATPKPKPTLADTVTNPNPNASER